MTPGERITLIQESARLLEAREWPDLDLILRQFGLRVVDDAEWHSMYAYAIDMLDDAPEAALRQVHSFLVGESGTSTVAQPWAQGELKLFMSHLAVHQEFVGQVGSALASDGASAFVAHTSIEPSADIAIRSVNSLSAVVALV